MLIMGSAPEPFLHQRACHHRCNLASTEGRIGVEALIEYDNQQSVFLELRVIEDGGDILLQPCIRLLQRSVVRIVIHVGNNKGKIRQLAVIKICCKLGERNQVEPLHAAVHHIGKIRKRIVVLQVRARIAADISHRGKALRITLPRLARAEQMAHDVIHIHRSGEGVVIGNDLAGSQHEVIADRGMSIGEILRGQRVLRREAIEEWHGGIADDAGKAMVLFQNNHHVGRGWNLRMEQQGK